MGGRRARRRRHLLIASQGNRAQVRFVERLLDQQAHARRERRHRLHRQMEPAA